MPRSTTSLAIQYALLNACMLSAMGLFAKLLGQYFGPVEVTFFRNISSILFLIVFMAFMGGFSGLRTTRPLAHFIRSLIGTAGIVVGMWSYSLSPLMLATVLYFTSPLFVILLSYPVLGEKVGPWRIGGVIAGFIGVLVIASPALFSASQDITLLGVGVGMLYGFLAGCVDISLRWVGKTENPTTTTFYFMSFGIIATSLYWPFSANSPMDLDSTTLMIILALGLTGIISQLSKTQSFRLGSVAMLAPITFTMIIWAGLFDYLVWGKLPEKELLIGSVIIIGSNMLILWREHRKNIYNPPDVIAP
jgi:drug/metabolite transporter (DMT)-like permease